MWPQASWLSADSWEDLIVGSCLLTILLLARWQVFPSEKAGGLMSLFSTAIHFSSGGGHNLPINVINGLFFWSVCSVACGNLTFQSIRAIVVSAGRSIPPRGHEANHWALKIGNENFPVGSLRVMVKGASSIPLSFGAYSSNIVVLGKQMDVFTL